MKYIKPIFDVIHVQNEPFCDITVSSDIDEADGGYQANNGSVKDEGLDDQKQIEKGAWSLTRSKRLNFLFLSVFKISVDAIHPVGI